MAHLPITVCRQFARARRDKGMTQSALAQAAGCKQSAISMLESGQPEKLSQEAVGKIASLLGVAIESPASRLNPEPRTPSPLSSVYCPDAACPSNVPYTLAGELLFWPRPQPSASGGRHCASCGEVLERQCPHCGAAVTEGACCHLCGGAKITNTLPPEIDHEAWAAQRRREIAEWRTLLT
ncbi:MAG: helix-turn-helix domain-containing protein [bacterium]